MWSWTGQRAEAAMLVAEDRLLDREIAAKVGVGEFTICRWKREPEFQARVRELVAASEEAVKERGIASRTRRIAVLDDCWRRLRRIIEVRSKELAHLPGGDTGLMKLETRKVLAEVTVQEMEGGSPPPSARARRFAAAIASGQRVTTVNELVLDVALLRELREVSKQAAMELGQWDSKVLAKEAGNDLIYRALDRVWEEMQAEGAPMALLGDGGPKQDRQDGNGWPG